MIPKLLKKKTRTVLIQLSSFLVDPTSAATRLNYCYCYHPDEHPVQALVQVLELDVALVEVEVQHDLVPVFVETFAPARSTFHQSRMSRFWLRVRRPSVHHHLILSRK